MLESPISESDLIEFISQFLEPPYGKHLILEWVFVVEISNKLQKHLKIKPNHLKNKILNLTREHHPDYLSNRSKSHGN
jgi:hypothetical protein